MAGRTVYERWVEKYGEEEANERQASRIRKSEKASLLKWQDSSYRALIKATTSGLKRSDDFKKTQRNNALKQFEDQSQRDLRSEAIKASYERGTHHADNLASNQYGIRGFTEDGIFYASNVERKRIEFLKASGFKWKRYEVGDFDFRIRYQWEETDHLYLPDFVIWKDGEIIVEEMKSNLKYISDREWTKAKTAGPFLKARNITFRIIDDPNYPI